MSNNPKISVIMSSYNRKDYIKEAIESILNQTYQDFEFIIIDDCSNKETQDVIEQYAQKDERIIFLKNEHNMGQALTRNRGLEVAKGQYIAILDDDDISLSTRFEKQVEYMINELGMKLLPINKKEGMSDGFIKGTIRMYPHINRGEGQFIAMLQKITETAISKEKILKPNLKKEQLQLVQKFYQENLNIPVPPYLYQSNNHVYAILNHFPELSIKVLRNGLYLGECKKGRFEPSLSLALTLNKEDVKRSYNFKCDSQEVKDYLSGLTLKGNNQKGYGVIFVDGYPLSFYKESNNQVKNLYPKGLRR